LASFAQSLMYGGFVVLPALPFGADLPQLHQDRVLLA
jgi:hypothetical protein